MAVITGIAELTRPADHAHRQTGSGHRAFGLGLALIGFLLGMAGLATAIVAGIAVAQGTTPDHVGSLEILGFGIAVAALGTAKTGIAFVLWGIVRRIWVRIATLKRSLPELCDVRTDHPPVLGRIRTPFGTAEATGAAPSPLLIHRMARIMWAPMLGMGAMALYAGLALAILAAQATDPAQVRALKAWTQGTQFLGEGLLLSAISFFLGSILGAIRSGGGEVQELLGVGIHTLRMPITAKVFVALMIAGLMVEVAQFALYAYTATLPDAGTFATFATWLGPFREFGLGLLLSAIVFALATIAKGLDFQFARVSDLIRYGR